MQIFLDNETDYNPGFDLEELTKEGLFTALEKGIFGDVKRPKTGGKGLQGVTMKGENYLNPFIELMKGKK